MQSSIKFTFGDHAVLVDAGRIQIIDLNTGDPTHLFQELNINPQDYSSCDLVSIDYMFKQFYLQTFYENPWLNHTPYGKYNESDYAMALDLLEKAYRCMNGQLLRHWGIKNHYKYSRSYTKEINGVERSILFRHSFDIEFNHLVVELVGINNKEEDGKILKRSLEFREIQKEFIPGDLFEIYFEKHKKEFEKFYLTKFDAETSHQKLRCTAAYWDPENKEIKESLDVPPELLDRNRLIKLVRELDRRFIQLWDKIGYENRSRE